MRYLQDIAKRLRINSFKITTIAESGHPTTCSSCAEIMACLFFKEMKYNVKDPNDVYNDEFILSKGHAAPILWSAYAEAGIISESKLESLRKINSNLEGHPTTRMPWVKAATGSLGQGLSVGVGMALAKKLQDVDSRVYVLLGDGECAEGNVWEAVNTATYYKLNNLIAIMDVNRLGQSQVTMLGHKVNSYQQRFQAFGWNTIIVDGHDVEQLVDAFDRAKNNEGPTMIIARTIKGFGVKKIADKNGWHGKPLNEQELKLALKELGSMPEIESKKYVKARDKTKKLLKNKPVKLPITKYEDKLVATRTAFGKALKNIGSLSSVITIDGDVRNSTKTQYFFEKFPKRSFESFIAEQNMVGMALGFSALGFIPVPATFAAFFTRAHDQIRMAAYSNCNIKYVGSHCGVSIGEDGPSQMGLEDIAMFRSSPNAIILYPCDAISTEKCVESMINKKGMVYLRTTRPKTPIIYNENENFSIGGFKVLRKDDGDEVTIIAAGITVHEALKVEKVRVIDLYCVQPISNKLKDSCTKKIIVVEDHYLAGGIGEAVKNHLGNNFEIEHLYIKEMPRSGKKDELLDKYGISAKQIIKKIEEIS